jgi:hypothetical protein
MKQNSTHTLLHKSSSFMLTSHITKLASGIIKRYFAITISHKKRVWASEDELDEIRTFCNSRNNIQHSKFEWRYPDEDSARTMYTWVCIKY